MQSSPLITGKITILDLIAIFPQSTDILAAYGLSCFSCPYGGSESLTEGCSAHGFSGEMTAALLQDLNLAMSEAPRRPQRITVTPVALREARKEENRQSARERKVKSVKSRKETWGLRVQLDGQGGFCMEFRTKPMKGDVTLKPKTKAGIPLFVPRFLFIRVGGAVIDYQDGRFQLDLASEDCSR